MKFGAKPPFKNIAVKFAEGNRYGLIAANGCGKSTLCEFYAVTRSLRPVMISVGPDLCVGERRQDQFAYEAFTVVDTVIMGHETLWVVHEERDRIYGGDMNGEDGMRLAHLEVEFGEMDGYTAEARAGELLIGFDIPVEQHFQPMSTLAPGMKIRVLLAQVLFSDPDICG